MALIYANAVNKRIHNHNSKVATKKRSTVSCQMALLHDDSPENDQLRRSSSREMPTRKQTLLSDGKEIDESKVNTCDLQKLKFSDNSSYLSSSTSSCHSLSPAVVKIDKSKHRPVQRSKTSCGDLYLKKIVEDDAVRKSSHPVMSDSMIEKKRSASKKSFIQEYEKDQKTKSASLDEDDKEKEKEKDNGEDGAFSKMKRKFSKLMFN